MDTKRKKEIADLDRFKNRNGVVKILLVDDLKDNLLALEALLKRADIEIFKAKSGTEALEFMIPHDFCLALIDIQMPGMSGFELATFMRGAKKTKNIPIIFVTAKTEVKDWTHAIFNMGANSYITKPINAKKLTEKVKSVLKMKHSRDELRKTREKLAKTMEDK